MTNRIALPPAKSITFEFSPHESADKRTADIVLIALTALTLIIQLVTLCILWKNKKSAKNSHDLSIEKVEPSDLFGKDLNLDLSNPDDAAEQLAQPLKADADS